MEKMMVLRGSLVFTFVIVSACSNNNAPYKPGQQGGADLGGSGVGYDLSAGSDGGGVDGFVAVVDMAGFNMAGSPTITITAPAAGAEISGDTLNVTATIVSPTNTLIAAGSTAVLITPPGGSVVTALLTLTAMPNVYAGSIDTSQVPSGPATFTVVASDLAGLKGSAQGSYVHDHGPILTFVQPTAMTAKDSISVEIIVDDSLHPVTDLKQVQAGIRKLGDITLTQVAGALPFRVAGTVNFNNYSPALSGQQLIQARATNVKGTVGNAQRSFIVDNVGPSITFVNPTAGQFIGGVLEIKATITDLSGVDDNSVVAVFGGDLSKSVALQRLDPTAFHGFYDVRALGTSYVLPELSIRADDLLGNHSELGEEIVVDNTKPWMTMNAGVPLRVAKHPSGSNTAWECSQLFYPLGNDTKTATRAAREGDTVLRIVTLRARVEDHGNTAPGLLVERFAGLDAGSGTLFALPLNTTAVLAVDTDGDGVCDDVNPTLVPTSNVTMSGEALALSMVPLVATGTPDYTPSSTVPLGCDVVGDGNVTSPPGPLCLNDPQNDMTYVLQYSDPVAPIWSLAPATTAECVGFQLDTLNRLPEGPTCVITRAADRAGNVNVSVPLHICIDRGGGLCANFTPKATDCTGVWDKVQQKIVAGTCGARASNGNPGTFPTDGTEIRYLLNPH